MRARSLPSLGGASRVTADSPPLKRATLRPAASLSVVSLSKTTRPFWPQLGTGSSGLAWVTLFEPASPTVDSSSEARSKERSRIRQSYSTNSDSLPCDALSPRQDSAHLDAAPGVWHSAQASQ